MIEYVFKPIRPIYVETSTKCAIQGSADCNIDRLWQHLQTDPTGEAVVGLSKGKREYSSVEVFIFRFPFLIRPNRKVWTVCLNRLQEACFTCLLYGSFRYSETFGP